MSDNIELIKALSNIAWPICIFAIMYLFRSEIKRALSRNKSEISEKEVQPPSKSLKIEAPKDTQTEIILEISVCRNKKSGNYFIVLDDSDDNELLLITPKSETKCLSRSLFTEPESLDEHFLKKSGSLSQKQLDSYYKYIVKSEEEYVAEQVSSQGKSAGEPEYRKTYRRMLQNPRTMPSIMLRIIQRHGRIKWPDLIEQLKKHGYNGTGGSITASLCVLKEDGHVRVDGNGDSKVVAYSKVLKG